MTMDALEAAILRPFSTSAVSAGSWISTALIALLGAGRRYTLPPKPASFPPAPDGEEARSVRESAQAAIAQLLQDVHAIDRGTLSKKRAAALPGFHAQPLPEPARCGRVAAQPLHREAAPPSALRYKPLLDGLCAAPYSHLIPDPHEALHSEALGVKSHIHVCEDLISVYKVCLLPLLCLSLPALDATPDASASDALRDMKRQPLVYPQHLLLTSPSPLHSTPSVDQGAA
jgi:hypothetical protein